MANTPPSVKSPGAGIAKNPRFRYSIAVSNASIWIPASAVTTPFESILTLLICVGISINKILVILS